MVQDLGRERTHQDSVSSVCILNVRERELYLEEIHGPFSGGEFSVCRLVESNV